MVVSRRHECLAGNDCVERAWVGGVRGGGGRSFYLYFTTRNTNVITGNRKKEKEKVSLFDSIT